jgi:DNA invertase Pin-like site-specific DNA recombinase
LNGQPIGDVRVSSVDQNPERQLEQVQVERVFTDKVSDKDAQRSELESLLAVARDFGISRETLYHYLRAV